jgi:hypothetical protein
LDFPANFPILPKSGAPPSILVKSENLPENPKLSKNGTPQEIGAPYADSKIGT